MDTYTMSEVRVVEINTQHEFTKAMNMPGNVVIRRWGRCECSDVRCGSTRLAHASNYEWIASKNKGVRFYSIGKQRGRINESRSTFMFVRDGNIMGTLVGDDNMSSIDGLCTGYFK